MLFCRTYLLLYISSETEHVTLNGNAACFLAELIYCCIYQTTLNRYAACFLAELIHGCIYQTTLNRYAACFLAELDLIEMIWLKGLQVKSSNIQLKRRTDRQAHIIPMAP